MADDRAAVLQSDDLAVTADEALELAREGRARGRDEGSFTAYHATPRFDGGVIVLLRECSVEQRADGGVVRRGGRQGRRDAGELFRTDEEGLRIVLVDDEIDVFRAGDERGRESQERCREDEGEELLMRV